MKKIKIVRQVIGLVTSYFTSLGDTILCVTGAEALFADVGHFSVRSIQVSTCVVTYPAIILAYTGQISFLRKHNEFVSEAFFKSVPSIAVVFVMLLTSVFLVLIMIIVWKTSVLLILAYVLIIGSVELLYLSAVLSKFEQGGYLPLVFAFVLMTIMYVWNYVYRQKYDYELKNKISPADVIELVANPTTSRVEGFAIFYSELVQGIPPIFKHYLANIPVIHSVLTFVSFKCLPISKIPMEERFIFHRVDTMIYSCAVTYGYTDMGIEEEPFETILVNRLKDFIRRDYVICQDENGDECIDSEIVELIDTEVEQVDRAREAGMVHLVPDNDVIAGAEAGVIKRFLINQAYKVIQRNLCHDDKFFDIPRQRLLKLGMSYEL